ncbi:uncharacterized protein EV420DRAFT_1487162 [Desarmillaria tabescens]|uniref:Heterokaryon incompatibility domain-containing protein n=1 Tax=Armillaria tabescens TaxID=1929756 RepID=A0AA39JAS9_ARMTA|nr:uncharacterized protein EV420DRAFT_1487162 [Desarmillaria tabescens]KAK0437293.1 hypothetical protein EV420DRAFT_1487162 [Desarmillaria tabescens]
MQSALRYALLARINLASTTLFARTLALAWGIRTATCNTCIPPRKQLLILYSLVCVSVSRENGKYPTILALSTIAGRSLLRRVKLIWKGLCSSFTAAKDSFPNGSSRSDQNRNPIPPSESESQEAILDSSDGFFDSDEFHVPVKMPGDIVLPQVTISAFTETGIAESSIKVPLQRVYTSQKPIISSCLADTPCADLGIQGILDQLNTTLGTSHSLDIPSLSSVLEDCIANNYDFGTAYCHLRRVWYTSDWSTIKDKLRRDEKKDRERREKALVGNRIVNPRLPPRRVWDLYGNRVVPWWYAEEWPKPISHRWMDEKDRNDVWTPINGYEWPVPIPKDVSLNLIRIEMLNLGAEYTWLDVLCLRQMGGPKEEIRVEEWRLDVPTIGRVYDGVGVVIYLSGLGRPLSLKECDMDDDRNWFRRAWTLQDVGIKRIIAGDTPDGPLHAKPIDDIGNYESEILTRFHWQLKSLEGLTSGYSDTIVNNTGQYEPREMQSPERAHVQRLGEVRISASDETRIPVSSIKIPLQREYRGRNPVIQPSLANTLCADLGIDGVLYQLNTALGTSYEMSSPLSLLLESWNKNGYDFGTAYGHIRPRWYTSLMSIEKDFRILEEDDQTMRKDAVRDSRTVKAQTPPRRVWDLYSNRVVPQWVIPKKTAPWAISHAWMDEKDRVKVCTPINRKEWPVPIPKDADLNFIRIEMLNLGAEYVWVDVLCLRQEDGDGEAQRTDSEWPLDVPTIGYVYRWAKMVVYYFSGLGRLLDDTAGNVESRRCWFKRAWTLQEISQHRIYAGTTDDSLTYAQAVGEKDRVRSFHEQLVALKKLALEDNSIFKWCRHMQTRSSVHPTDKVVGLAFPLRSLVIPAYDVNRSDEDTWKILVESMAEELRGEIFFLCPECRSIELEPRTDANTDTTTLEEGLKHSKWAPSWKQIMDMTLLSADSVSLRELVIRNDKKGIEETGDYHDGFCIESANVEGLFLGEPTKPDRYGRMIVIDHTGTSHVLNVVAMHQHPIPEGPYTTIGSRTMEYWVVGRRIPKRRFEKVSVIRIPNKDERKRLKELGVHTNSRNYLI